jgi:prevent-host-death family protein
MNYLPEIASISDMRIRSGEIVAAAQRGPVILIEKGSRPALVAISPERWNALMARLELLEETLAVYETRLNQATGKSRVIPFTLADYLTDDPVIPETNSPVNRQEEGQVVPVSD